MKSLNLILFSFLLIMSSCNAQDKKDTYEEILNNSVAQKQDAHAKPDIRFKVNKQYDEKGNVVSYDSTYSYHIRVPVKPI